MAVTRIEWTEGSAPIEGETTRIVVEDRVLSQAAALDAGVAATAAQSYANQAQVAEQGARDALGVFTAPAADVITDILNDTTSTPYKELSATFAARNSVYLSDFLTAGATAAENRTAYVAAVAASASGPKRLCYDGSTFTFEGTAITDTTAGVVHWASDWTTHKVTQQTKGRGILRLEGADSLATGLNFDGENPTLDFSTAAAELVNNGAFRYSYGIALIGAAHRSVIRDVKVGGFFHATLVSAVPPETIAAGAPGVTKTTHPPISDILVDGVHNNGCWTACMPGAFRNVRVRRLTGWYQASMSSGGEPHQIYAGWLSSDYYSENLDVADCSTSGEASAPQTQLVLTRHAVLSASSLRTWSQRTARGSLTLSMSKSLKSQAWWDDRTLPLTPLR